MKVLVIGGTGFIGYALVWRLIAAEHRVTLLNRGRQPDPFGGRVERLIADRTTHQFADVIQGYSFEVAVDFTAYNGEQVREALRVLRSGGNCHYILISSGQVYLVREGYRPPARESDYYGPLLSEPDDLYEKGQWSYGLGKRDAEDVLVEAWASSGFPSTRFRLPMVNGERDPSRRIETYLWRILDGGPVLLPDGGTNVVRHVYSGDVAAAITALAGNPRTYGEAYNLSQDRMPTLRELVTMLAEILGAPARVVPVGESLLRAVGLDPRTISPFSTPWMSCLDPSKARVELGFHHQPLLNYLEKIVASFLAHPPDELPENYSQRRLERDLAVELVRNQQPSPGAGEESV